MFHISRVRLAIPKAAAGELKRKELVAAILNSQKRLVYIQAGAGFGKTTLLSQAANSTDNIIWVTIDGENDVFTFLNLLSAAHSQAFSGYEFTASEYLPFEKTENFITNIANAFLNSLEKLEKDFMIILEDLHTIENPQVRKLIAYIIKYLPDNIKLCLSSREAPWLELVPFQIKGSLLEITQKELSFTREEVHQILGFDDEYIYKLTEGWPLAVGSFKVLLDNGAALDELNSSGSEVMNSYLFYECISRLSPEKIDFLKLSSCFDELHPIMLDNILESKNSKLLLDSFVHGNLFTIKTGNGYYRYHTLFKHFLSTLVDSRQVSALHYKAAGYYFDNKKYYRAAEYAIRLNNRILLEQIILNCYKDYIKSGDFNILRVWFQTLGASSSLSDELKVAKGAFLSSIGNFTEANECLDMALLKLSENNHELYMEAMLHKARVLRNFISFEESNQLLDQLIPKVNIFVSELTYDVVIEKIYNLSWNSQINEAHELTYHMIEACAKAGNIRIKAWFERYMSVIYFLEGRMNETIYYYEKSLKLSEEDRKYLSLHSIDIFAAKAYQMLGERDKAVSMITAELKQLNNMGRYEELWLGYLFAAEIYYQNVSIDRANGGSQTYDITIRYFMLADEYAPLYRKTDYQLTWSRIQRNIYSLMFSSEPNAANINEIIENLYQVQDYFKTLALGRLFNYYGTLLDYANAVKYAKLSIEIGERANMMLIPTMAYGLLARSAIALKDLSGAEHLTRHFLKLCHDNGIYEYFRMRKAYDPILEFAFEHQIEPEITHKIMDFAGYKVKKVYVRTLGGFSVFSYKDRQEPIKMRTKKERELFAFLLDAGREGATKEQICEALWFDTDSEDVKKLIGVNLTQIKKDLSDLGVENSIINHEKHYSICRDEITVDIELFEEASGKFLLQKNSETAMTILSLYKGEYLSGFEALWAVSNRLRYQEIYDKALNYERELRKQ